MSFLPYKQCNQVPMVSRLWNYGANMYQEYVDIRNCVPWTAFRPHAGQVDSLFIDYDKIYTGGDKRIYANSLYNGTILSQIARDSGDIPRLLAREGQLFVCSTNGSMRTYALTHTGTYIYTHLYRRPHLF